MARGQLNAPFAVPIGRRLTNAAFLSIICSLLLGLVAQGLEQGTHNPLVVGSKPTGPTKY